MPLRNIISSISPIEFLEPISNVLNSIVQSAKSANPKADFSIWLAEEYEPDWHFFYLAASTQKIGESPDTSIISSPIQTSVSDEELKESISKEFGGSYAEHFPFSGPRFGQKYRDQYLYPVRSLIGFMTVAGEHDRASVDAVLSLASTLIWQHRSSRFLACENTVRQTLESAKERNVNWKEIIPKLSAVTHSDTITIFQRNKGELQCRFALDESVMGVEFFKQEIEENMGELLSGRWLRSKWTTLKDVEDNPYWMVVPIQSTFYSHEESNANSQELRVTSRAQHFAVFETLPTEFSSTFRSMYSSADRRVIEQSLTRYLDGIAQFRIEFHTNQILKHLPTVFPEDPLPALEAIMEEICISVHDVVGAFAVEATSIKNEKGFFKSFIGSNIPENLETEQLEKLLMYDHIATSYMNTHHEKCVKISGFDCLAFSIGTVFRKRFLIFMFSEPYSSYVTTEICSRLASKIELFWKGCDLQNDQTSMLTQISHVLRGPVNSALEDIKAINQGKNSQILQKFTIKGERTDRQIMADVISSLSRARALTDSAKHLLGALKEGNFQNRKVDFLSVYNEVRYSLEVQRSRRNVVIDMSDQTSPVDKGTLFILGDEDLLWLLLYNLMENAIKYSRRASTVQVRIVDVPGEHIRFTVANEGDLIWESDVERIFYPYQRAVGGMPMNGRQGTGIGLPAALQIAEAFAPNFGIRLHQSNKRSRAVKTGTITFETRLERFNDK